MKRVRESWAAISWMPLSGHPPPRKQAESSMQVSVGPLLWTEGLAVITEHSFSEGSSSGEMHGAQLLQGNIKNSEDWPAGFWWAAGEWARERKGLCTRRGKLNTNGKLLLFTTLRCPLLLKWVFLVKLHMHANFSLFQPNGRLVA